MGRSGTEGTSNTRIILTGVPVCALQPTTSSTSPVSPGRYRLKRQWVARRSPMASSTRCWPRRWTKSRLASSPFHSENRLPSGELPAAHQAQLITTADDLRALAGRLQRASLLAFDTEAASFHRYIDRVYLIQVSSPDETAIIDPLALERLDPIGALLADPGIEV